MNHFLFYFLVSLIADGPHYYHPACGHKGSSHLCPVHAIVLSRPKFSTLTTRQPMVEFYLLTFPRFPLLLLLLLIHTFSVLSLQLKKLR